MMPDRNSRLPVHQSVDAPRSPNRSSAQDRVLVTGGAGFIGSHVADAYLGLGHDVCIVDNLSTGRRENVPEGARFVELDVRDREGLLRLMRDSRFGLVSHQAAQVDVRVSVGAPAADAETNVIGLINVADAASQTGVGRFLFASSGGAIYGEVGDRPAREGDPKLPLAPYGISKMSGEMYLAHFAETRGLDFASLRYANVYGPRQDPRGEAGVVAIFCGRLKERRRLTIFGDGTQQRDYTHVHDVVAANLLLSEVPLGDICHHDERAYNVGTGVATEVSRLADILEGISGANPGREYGAARHGELSRSVLDASRLRALGWRPRRELTGGLRSTYASLAR